MKHFLLIAPLLLLFSCTVQKRHYNKGFFVSWKKSTPKRSEQVVSKKLPVSAASESRALIPQKRSTVPVPKVDSMLAAMPAKKGGPEDSCDVLLYKNGSESKVRITEVNETQVKYKRCDMPDGPQYICNKTDLFKISYANGTFEVVRVKEKEPEQVKNDPNNNDAYNQWLKERDRPKYRPKNTKLATCSMVFGSLSFYPLVFIGGIIAIIAGVVQLNRISANPEQYGAEKKALVGIGLGIASILLWTLFIAFFILVL